MSGGARAFLSDSIVTSMRKTRMKGFILFYLLQKRQLRIIFGSVRLMLVFGHTIRSRGPLKLLKEKWLTKTSNFHILDYVSDFKEHYKLA